MTSHATRITADDHQVTVVSNDQAVTDWATRYFGAWWNASSAGAPISGPVVAAYVDEERFASLAGQVTASPEEVVYANAPMLFTRDGDTVTAVQPSERLAYEHRPGHLQIVGAEAVPVALAAARLAREMLRGQLLAAGWAILHASAVTHGGRTVLTLGGKGAGKSTTAVLLARSGWELLANDRVFVRAGADGAVRVLPWPSAAALGLGLLDATGLYDGVRARVLDGEQLHPTQHARVTAALVDGSRAAVWKADGKELKPQFFPDQLADWLGMTLSTEGVADRLLFPRIAEGAVPAVVDTSRELEGSDFFTGATEDRYPDVFGLTPEGVGKDAARALDALRSLPRHSVALGHDVQENAAFLARLVA
ncbi:hypothetical protein ACIPRL_08020 [Streptomyces sp. NPDC090085]|uniref:hypothetical protein n=1 Tax=Streptomyces sp. NPDC090085 TaxID=3365943 RepID=UPI00381CA6C7